MKTILIVEDNYDFASFIESLLRRTWPESDIHFARNPREALAELDKYQPDLITLDGSLNPGHGREILASLSPELKAKAIAISNDNEFLDEAFANGINGFDKMDYRYRLIKTATEIFDKTEAVN